MATSTATQGNTANKLFYQSDIQNLRMWIATMLSVVILILLAYWRALSVGFLSDDHLMLAFASVAPMNLEIFTPQSNRWLLFHRPLPLVVWQSMYQFWGLNPVPYHLLSLILHILNSLLLSGLVYLLFPQKALLAIITGLLFAVYPLNVEVVVWLSCWFDLFALNFYIFTLITFILALQRKKITWYLLSSGAYQLAIWSKESAFTLLAVALVVGLILQPRPKFHIIALSIVPYCVLLAVNLFQRYLAWGSIGGYAGVSDNLADVTFNQLLDTLFVIIAPLNRTLFSSSTIEIVSAVIVTVLMIGLIITRKPRVIIFGSLWIILTVVPVLNLLPIGFDLQNARLLYPVVVGYIIILSSAVDNILESFRPRTGNIVRVGVVSGMVLSGIVAIHMQIQPWIVATRATETILDEMQEALPPARLGTVLQVANPPDNYRGAYIFRLGFDSAMLVRSGELYIHWPDYSVAPIPYTVINLDRDFFQVVIQSDEQQQYWSVGRVRGVTFPEELPTFPTEHWIFAMNEMWSAAERATTLSGELSTLQEWDLRDCQQFLQWEITNAVSECEPGSGIVLKPQGRDPMITLPISDISIDKWVQIEVTLETLSSTTEQASIQVFWGAVGEMLVEERSVSIELPDTPRTLSYQFFIPPREAGTRLATLRIDPINQEVPVRLTTVRIRQNP